MSTSIPIPRRKKPHDHHHPSAMTPTSASSYGSSFASGAGLSSGSSGTTMDEVERKGLRDRKQSLLGSSLSKTEHTVINVGTKDCPRLITCVKTSQGFDWNQEIFLPSYIDHSSDDLERRQDPIEDIIVTDEEMATMFPS
ncbi:hypothetical protein GQ43DRAFT_444187 [Delitschia confertaspora ATCC 74209]|uniref:Uncharacterized protein n=1 Tax=Delitschia confertaspora ATCC 74209 TaxID=1513339 RepID=A0A9P4MV03_9PLEO|nr:hypothetical protein GQ43DRAFT_444187 [Delitschia confertaspora ATCC 74209]